MLRAGRSHGPALAAFTGRPTPPESCVSASPTLPPADEPARGLTLTQWLIVVMAAIGFAFDIYELLMLPLVLRPAILELGGMSPTDQGFADFVWHWRALMFYVPAV